MLRKSDQRDDFSYLEVSPLYDEELYHTSICAVNAKFIFVTGGTQSICHGDAIANCHRYDIVRNLWQEMQKMNQARTHHSSCQLSGHIYVFCGTNSLPRRTNTVEKLSIDADPNLQVLKKWELIPYRNLVDLPQLQSQFSIALNNDEILIFGGFWYREQKVQLFDTRTDSCSSVAVHGAFMFYNNKDTSNYPIAQCSHNKVVALVISQSDYKPRFIQYERQTNTISVLSMFSEINI